MIYKVQQAERCSRSARRNLESRSKGGRMGM